MMLRFRTPLIGALLAAGLVLSTLSGCSADDDWHPVTTEESQILALARFNNFDQGTRMFETDITVQGQDLHIKGWVDYLDHNGYAGVTGEGFDDQVLLWNSELVALSGSALDSKNFPPLDPGPFPEDTTAVRELHPESSALDTLLLLLLSLGSDRPENPLLLQQAGALWLDSERVEIEGESIELDVFSAPPGGEALTADDPQPTPEDATVKLKVDDRGVLHVVNVLIAGDWVTVTYLPAGDGTPEVIPTLEESNILPETP